MSNPDTYFNRTEVSNSDLTALKELLHPVCMPPGVREKAFRFGTLVDAIITEPERVNYYRKTVDDVEYSDYEFRHAKEMHYSLKLFAKNDPFLAKVLKCAETQRVSIGKQQEFEYGDFRFTLDTRCKWDWWLRDFGFGGDLKTTAAATQKEFEDAIDFFDWDRSRAWYMDIVHSDCDFIYAISKRNCNVFTTRIRRNDPVYMHGRDKYQELAFQYWCLAL